MIKLEIRKQIMATKRQQRLISREINRFRCSRYLSEREKKKREQLFHQLFGLKDITEQLKDRLFFIETMERILDKDE